jgi:hypothetical protein
MNIFTTSTLLIHKPPPRPLDCAPLRDGGTMAGVFSAMVAALLAGLIFPMLLGRRTS